MEYLKNIFRLLRQAFDRLVKNHPLMMASSTAFFTLFSIPPMLIIVINILSAYFMAQQVTDQLFQNIRDTFGESSAEQVRVIVENFEERGGSNVWITIGGSVFLVFIATNLFKIIKLSIDQIWNIREKAVEHMFFFKLKQRAIALGIIFLMGILFLLSTVSDSFIAIIQDYLEEIVPQVDTFAILLISKIISWVFVTLWFGALFRFLPDAKVRWRAIRVGAAVTGLLFVLGKYALEELLINSDINNIFETSTSIVLILLFIFYASLIMYYGASFTLVYANMIHSPVTPRKYAEKYVIRAIAENSK